MKFIIEADVFSFFLTLMLFAAFIAIVWMAASLHRWKQIAERQNDKIEGMSRDYTAAAQQNNHLAGALQNAQAHILQTNAYIQKLKEKLEEPDDGGDFPGDEWKNQNPGRN